MICLRCRPDQPMYRVKNVQGTAIEKCNRCCKSVECALCPKCGNKICLACYNKTLTERSSPPNSTGPLLDDGFKL